MAELRCADGSVLSVRPVPVSGRDGAPYEVTLELLRDGALFGAVGERCGYFLEAAAAALRGALPDFPASSVEAGVRSWARDGDVDPTTAWGELQRYLPRDRELFCFRSRDPDDLASAGELRVTMEELRSWLPAADGANGHWQIDCCAVVQAWGTRGLGVRAVLSGAQLLAFLESLLAEVAEVGASYDDGSAATSGRLSQG